MQKEVASFAHYGKSFQEKLTRLVLEDRQFSDQISEVMDIGFFETKYLQIFNEKIFTYKTKYGTHPTKSIVETILRTELEDENELVKKQVRGCEGRSICQRTCSGVLQETKAERGDA
jgi:hypothetical protein